MCPGATRRLGSVMLVLLLLLLLGLLVQLQDLRYADLLQWQIGFLVVILQECVHMCVHRSVRQAISFDRSRPLPFIIGIGATPLIVIEM